MKYGFNVYKTQVEDHVFWVAESKDLKGCVGQGETLNEALKELECNELEWLETAKEYAIKIPNPTIEKSNVYSGKFVTRVSPVVHKEAVEKAAEQEISLNQYVNNAIVTMNTVKTMSGFVKESAKEIKAMMLLSTKQAWEYTSATNTIKYGGVKSKQPGLNFII